MLRKLRLLHLNTHLVIVMSYFIRETHVTNWLSSLYWLTWRDGSVNLFESTRVRAILKTKKSGCMLYRFLTSQNT